MRNEEEDDEVKVIATKNDLLSLFISPAAFCSYTTATMMMMGMLFLKMRDDERGRAKMNE